MAQQASECANAGRSVFIAAGKYLGVPTAFILCIADVIRLEDLTVQTSGSELVSIERNLQHMRNDPRLAAFVPDEIHDAEPKVKSLVLFMYRELTGSARWLEDAYGTSDWVRVLHAALIRTLENELVLSREVEGTKKR